MAEATGEVVAEVEEAEEAVEVEVEAEASLSQPQSGHKVVRDGHWV